MHRHVIPNGTYHFARANKEDFMSWNALPYVFAARRDLGQLEKDHECHLKPDLLLIYKKPDEKPLRLVRLGSHSQLFAK